MPSKADFPIDDRSLQALKSLKAGDMLAFYFASDAAGSKAGLIAALVKDPKQDPVSARGTQLRQQIGATRFCRGVALRVGGQSLLFVHVEGNAAAQDVQKVLRNHVSKVPEYAALGTSFTQAQVKKRQEMKDASPEIRQALGFAPPREEQLTTEQRAYADTLSPQLREEYIEAHSIAPNPDLHPVWGAFGGKVQELQKGFLSSADAAREHGVIVHEALNAWKNAPNANDKQDKSRALMETLSTGGELFPKGRLAPLTKESLAAVSDAYDRVSRQNFFLAEDPQLEQFLVKVDAVASDEDKEFFLRGCQRLTAMAHTEDNQHDVAATLDTWIDATGIGLPVRTIYPHLSELDDFVKDEVLSPLSKLEKQEALQDEAKEKKPSPREQMRLAQEEAANEPLLEHLEEMGTFEGVSAMSAQERGGVVQLVASLVLQPKRLGWDQVEHPARSEVFAPISEEHGFTLTDAFFTWLRERLVTFLFLRIASMRVKQQKIPDDGAVLTQVLADLKGWAERALPDEWHKHLEGHHTLKWFPPVEDQPPLLARDQRYQGLLAEDLEKDGSGIQPRLTRNQSYQGVLAQDLEDDGDGDDDAPQLARDQDYQGVLAEDLADDEDGDAPRLVRDQSYQGVDPQDLDSAPRLRRDQSYQGVDPKDLESAPRLRRDQSYQGVDPEDLESGPPKVRRDQSYQGVDPQHLQGAQGDAKERPPKPRRESIRLQPQAGELAQIKDGLAQWGARFEPPYGHAALRPAKELLDRLGLLALGADEQAIQAQARAVRKAIYDDLRPRLIAQAQRVAAASPSERPREQAELDLLALALPNSMSPFVAGLREILQKPDAGPVLEAMGGG